MLLERDCPHCKGSRYRVIAGANVTGWERASAERDDDHWFCPDCDWGSGEADNEPMP